MIVARTVIDTSALLTQAQSGLTDSSLWALIREGRVCPVVSMETYREFRRVLEYDRFELARDWQDTADVTRVAADHGSDFRPHTIAIWVQAGNADIRDGNNNTAYARFANIYADLREEHCSAETNRSRELDRALETIARTCECGNEKMLFADGTLADQCQVCHALDATPRRGRRRAAPSPVT